MATEDLDPLPPTVQELLREDDLFRLVIRAHAEIEQLIAAIRGVGSGCDVNVRSAKGLASPA